VRPLRLSLRAFGPFADTQVIDFRPALERRLFGIYGPMGAGKTSILDGLCFALFGESSGQERQGEDLRSHHASAEVETQAELVFDVGGKRYHLVRRPRQTVRGRRVGTLVERAHWAALYDATGMAVDDIGPDNPGVALEERKVEAVADRLQAILHYSAAQFRQVVLLPQGQFRQLLTASSDQRSAVLRGLFDVSLYERFVERLKAEASALRDAVGQGRTQIEAHLAAQDASDLEGLNQALADAAEQAMAQARLRDAEAQHRDRLRTALQTAQALAGRFAEHDAARAAVAALLDEQGKIEDLNVRHAAAAKAETCAAADARAAAAAQTLTTAATARRTALEEAERLDALAAAAADRLDQSAALQPERDAAVALVTGLDAYRTRLENARPLKDHALASASARAGAASALASAQSARAAAAEVLEQSLAQHARAQQQALRAEALETALALARKEHETAVDFEDAVKAVERLSALTASAQARLAAARLDLAKARSAEEAAETALSEAQASHLALVLVEGQPCLVCGSEAHPHPAKPAVDGQDLEQVRRVARTLRQDADTAERQAAEAAAMIEGEGKGADTRLRALKAPPRAAEQVAADCVRLEQDLAQLLAADLAGLAQALEAAQGAVGTADEALAETRTAFALADKDDAAAKAAFEAALSDVPKDLRDETRLTAARTQAIANRDQMLERHAGALAAERSASEAAKVAAATAEAAGQREGELEVTAKAEAIALEAALSAAGFDAAGYETAKADAPHLETFAAQIRAFGERAAAAADRRDRAAAAIADQARPDLALAEAALVAADTRLAGLEQAVSTIGMRLGQLEATRDIVAKLEDELALATERYRVLGELSNLSDGRNAHRLRLRDFAIAATFDLVLEAANLRFSRMSRGRFALQRKLEGGDGRVRSGLDIEVYDAHTDQKRDAHTLSGGEGFLASLSLALGLSDVVQAESGGVRLDAIFIDEGFGHLDDETLDIALETLRDLVGQDRAVGVISHVDGVKQQILAGFDVVRTLRGSQIAPRRDD